MTSPSPIHDLIVNPRPVGRRDDLDATERPGAAQGERTAVPDAEFVSYSIDETPGVTVLGTLGELQSEYAAIRRGAALIDCPQRGTVILSGADRLPLLNNIVTNKVDDMAPGQVRHAFLIQRTGRIIADLTIIAIDDRTFIDVDLHQAAITAQTLESYVFAEDVTISEASASLHQIQIHGQLAIDVLRTVVAEPLDAFENESARALTIDSTPITAVRRDILGVPGISIIVPADRAPGVWEFLVETDQCIAEGTRRIRPIGWFAANIARIEAGTPIMNVDFSTASLPHETSVLDDRVSFTKGCYPGQEIVARMHNLGKPKQQLVGLRMQSDHLPVAGAQVFAQPTEGETAMGDPIGAVTSSTLSPMLGATPIAFAMVRTAHAEHGGTLRVNAEGEQATATVQVLRFVDPVEAN